MNKVIELGRITKDVELKYTTNQTAVTMFTIAVNRKTKGEADFITCVAYGKQAEFISKYFKKGQQMAISGRLQTRNYDDKDGKKVYVTEVIVEEVDFAGSKEKEENDFTQPIDTSELPF